MANSIEAFDLTVASQLALDEMKLSLVSLNSFTTDVSTGHVSPAELRKGKTVHVRLYNDLGTTGNGSGDFSSSTQNYQDFDDLNIDTVSVALDQHKITTFSMSDADLELWTDGLPQQLIRNYGRKIGRMVTKEVQTSLLTATYAAETVVAATALDFDEVANQRKIMVDAGADMDQLTLVLDASYYLNLLQDDPMQTLISRQTNETYREARIGRIHGMDVIEAAEIQDNSESLAGWISDKSAVAIAGAILVPSRGSGGTAENIIDWAVASDPLTGLSVGMRKHYDPATGDTFVSMECVFGYAAGRVTGMSRLVTA